jgi:hypothetical protein
MAIYTMPEGTSGLFNLTPTTTPDYAKIALELANKNQYDAAYDFNKDGRLTAYDSLQILKAQKAGGWSPTIATNTAPATTIATNTAPVPVVTAADPNAVPATKAETASIPSRYTNIEVVKAPTADADQSQEPDKYFAIDSETGDRVELLKASEYPVGNGPKGTEWLARRAGDMITTPDGNFLPFEAVDSKGNIIGTWNMQKNELSDFAKVVGGATKIAAVALGGYAIGSSILNAAGLGGTAAGTAATSADAAFVGEMASQLAGTGIGQAQIAQTLVASGVGAEAAAAAAAAAAGGASAGTIAGSLAAGSLFTATAADLAAAGITAGNTFTAANAAALNSALSGGAATGGTTAGTVAGGTASGTAAGTKSAVTSSIPEVVVTGTKAATGSSLLPAAVAGSTLLGTADLLSGTNLPGQGLQVDPNAGLGDGATVNQSPTGGVSGGTGLDPNLIGAGAGVGGVLGSTGLLTGNNVVDLATGALGAAGNVGGALSLNTLSQLFPTGLGDLSQILSGTNLSNALTSQANTAAASNAASTAAKLGAAAPLINALVSGGLSQNVINDLKDLGAQAQKDYRSLAEEASRDVSFTPYGVSTGLFSTTRPTTTGVFESTLNPQTQALVDAANAASLGSFQQAGTADLNQMTADRMALYQQLVSPEQQRSRLAQEARLQAQGRLGVGAGGGEYAPELRALEDAIAKQNLQFALAAPQEALAQRASLITQGQAAGQLPLGISQQQLSALQLGGQLGQQQAQTAYQRGGLLGQYAGQGISENLLARLGAAQVASEQNKAIGTALGGLFV